MPQPDTLINELEEALSNGSAERRAKTFLRITDLFVFGSGHFSDDHIALFDSIFNRLIADIEETARENGIDQHIRYGHKVVSADWSSADSRWTLTLANGARMSANCFRSRLIKSLAIRRLARLRVDGSPGNTRRAIHIRKARG